MTHPADPRVDTCIGGLPGPARTISARNGEQMNAAALTALLRQVIASNRAGGWREVRAGG